VVIAGVEEKAALAVMTLPYSDAYFVSATGWKRDGRERSERLCRT
jgi:hypothetical protein